MQSASDAAYTRRKSCAKFFQQIYREEGLHGLYRVSGCSAAHPPSGLRLSPSAGRGPHCQQGNGRGWSAAALL